MGQARASYRRALRNRDFRLLVLALTQSSIGGWAYNVALVVYVYDKTHSAAWVSAATLGRMVPTFFTSPYAGVIAERFERVRVMVSADLIRAGLMVVLTVALAAGWPAWAAILVAAAVAVTTTPYNPATMAMLPQLLGEEDLAAGNAMSETINNVAIIAGPGLGAIVLALGSGAMVMALNGVTFLISAALVARMTARSTPTDVTRDGGVLRQMTVGLRAIVSSPAARMLTAFPILTTTLYGVDTVLFVFVSKDKLGTGANGYGYLLVALGVGGVISATFVNRLASLPRLSTILSLGMVAYSLPTLALVVVHSPGVAFGIEIVRGLSTLIVDVLAMTALQRTLAPDLIARVFGVFWALAIGGLSIGAFVAPVLLRTAGLNTTLAIAALVPTTAALVVLPRLSGLDRIASVEARELAPRVAVFSQLDLFAAASQPVLERLAKSSSEVLLEPGVSLIREGEPADALYVLVDGELDVSARGELGTEPQFIRTMTAPCYVGEIGVLQGIPRTASVAARTSVRLWRIDAESFLASLTETSLSPTMVTSMSARLARTHPSAAIHLPETRDPEPSESSTSTPT